MFQARPVHLKRASSLSVDLNSPIWVYLKHLEGARPSGTKLSREELQVGIEEEDQVAFPELSPIDKPIMPPLYPLLIKFRTLIGIEFPPVRSAAVAFSPLQTSNQIKVLNGPISHVFQLHGEVTRLAMDESKESGANKGLEGCAVGPKGVIELVHPILS